MFNIVFKATVYIGTSLTSLPLPPTRSDIQLLVRNTKIN